MYTGQALCHCTGALTRYYSSYRNISMCTKRRVQGMASVQHSCNCRETRSCKLALFIQQKTTWPFMWMWPCLGIPVHSDCIKEGCIKLLKYFRSQGFWGENFTFIYFWGAGVLQGTCTAVREQFVGGCSLLPSSRFQGPNSGSGLALLPTKTSHHLPPSHHFYLQAFNSL